MTTRRGPHNPTTVPVLDRHGQPLAPARPSRVRRWLESGRANKVWIKGIFAVRLNDLEVWPESHWPGFALLQVDVLQSYTA